MIASVGAAASAPHPDAASARGTARAGLCRRVVLGGHRVLDLPDRHRGVQPAVQFGGARGARGLPAAGHLRAVPAAEDQAIGLADRFDRFCRRPVPLGVRGRSGAACRRHDRCRHGHRRAHHRAGVRSGAAHHGLRAAADLPAVPRLRPVRPVPARRARRTAATASTRSSRNCPSAPRASTARRPTCRRATSSCSSCSAPSSNRPA